MLSVLLLLSLLDSSSSQREDGCEFTSHIINSTTISALANRSCIFINGSVRLDESSDVAHEVLQEVFRNIEFIDGVLEIVNTSYKDLSFFETLRFLSVDTEIKGYDLLISNNELLESMDGALMPFYMSVKILNNPLLVLDCSHILQFFSLRRVTRSRIYGNRENCGCELDGPLTQVLVNTLEDNCTIIFGNVVLPRLDPPPYEILMRKFGTVTRIVGEISIIDTQFVNLSFFGNVRDIVVEYDLQAPVFVEKFLRIENNDKLERLGWNSLQTVDVITVQISGNPNLCYAVTELSGLFTSLYINDIEGRICEENGPIDGGQNAKRACRIGNDAKLKDIPNDCGILIGRLTIDNATDPSQLWKLFNVTAIYGQLSIKNASINGLAALWKLERVVDLSGNETAVTVESNQHLKSMFLQSIVRIHSDHPVKILNNTIMTLSDEECQQLNKTAKIDSVGNRRNCPATTKSSTELFGWFERGNLVISILLASVYRPWQSFL